ncbi:O-antigen polymerase [Gottfriedia acidiceleris]|uniref:O-antigen polymerase n=1 Tax=Gottfriedia acidiceleris TaxID=371036 RepID=UPI003000ACD1
MLLTVLIFTGLLLAIGSIIAYKRVLNPVFIILIWYMTGIIISHSGLYGLYKPAPVSSEFILINILILCFSFFITSLTKTLKPIRISVRISEKVIEKAFSIMRIVSFLIQFVIAIHLLVSIFTGAINTSSIRLIVYSPTQDPNDYALIFFNSAIYNIFSFLIKGFILFDVCWNFCQFLTDNKKIRYISLINLLLYCFIMLSRIEILRIFIIFGLIFISIRYTRNKIKSETKRDFKKILIFFVIVMVITFSLRTSSGTSVIAYSIQEVIIDLTGSYVVFGNFFTNYFSGLRLIDSNVIAMLFGGLEPLFNIIFKFFGITIDQPTSVLNKYISPGTNIGASNHYNAFYTMYYNFLAGGGVVGCVMVSILLGFLLGKLYKFYIKNPTSESLLIYTFGLHIIILGCIRWELSTFSLFFMLILIIILTLTINTRRHT